MVHTVLYKGYKITAHGKLTVDTFIGGQIPSYEWAVKINGADVTSSVFHAGGVEAQMEYAKQLIDDKIEEKKYFASLVK